MTGRGGIVAFGAAVPRLRISRETIAKAIGWANPNAAGQKGERAICNWDEDAITLAVGAARSCLAHARERGIDTASIDAVILGSTTLPFADRDAAALVAAALDLGTGIETRTLGSSLRAGAAALSTGLRRTGGRLSLVIASDVRQAKPASPQELAYGHGAAAFLVGIDHTRALATLDGAASASANFVDHYRGEGEEFDYGLEERWVRDEGHLRLLPPTIEAALDSAGVAPADVSRLVMPQGAAVARKVAELAKLSSAKFEDTLAATCGDTGAAHPLLMLAAALETARSGERIVVTAFGQGAEALVFTASHSIESQPARPVQAALARRIPEPHYTRYLSHANILGVDFGMRAERDNRTAHTVAWRKARQVDALVGGKCRVCGTVQFPKFRVCVNPECRETDTLDDYRLAESTGRVKTFTEDWQAYSPRPPYIYGNVQFEAGGNLLMEFTDLEAGELAVGDTVRFEYRVKDVDALRGFRRYFWKAVRT